MHIFSLGPETADVDDARRLLIQSRKPVEQKEMQLIFSPPSAISTAIPCPVEVGASLAWFQSDTPWSRFKTPLWKSTRDPVRPDFDTDHPVAGLGTENDAETIKKFLGLDNLGLSTLGGSSGEVSDTECKWRPQVQSHMSALFGQVLFPSGEARTFTESHSYQNGTGNSGRSSTRCPILGCNHEYKLKTHLDKHLKVSSLGVCAERSCADIKNSNITTVNIFSRT